MDKRQFLTTLALLSTLSPNGSLWGSFHREGPVWFVDVDTDGARRAYERYVSHCQDLMPAHAEKPDFRFWPIRVSGLDESKIAPYVDGEMRKLIQSHPRLAILTNLRIARAFMQHQFDFPALYHTSQLPRIAEADSPRLIGHPSMTGFLSGVPLHAKRLELLRDFSSQASTVGILVDNVFFKEDEPLDEIQTSARQLKLKLLPVAADDLVTLRGALANIRNKVDAFIVPRIALITLEGPAVVSLLNQTGKPAIHSLSRLVRNGGLMSYEAAIEDAVEAFARQTVALLRGTPVNRIPVEYPRRFRLALNLATANAMNVKFPAALLRRAELIIPAT
jgi:ABC-type uncharacterized transport system substrate-binding protein